jgi:hypothetical protein
MNIRQQGDTALRPSLKNKHSTPGQCQRTRQPSRRWAHAAASRSIHVQRPVDEVRLLRGMHLAKPGGCGGHAGAPAVLDAQRRLAPHRLQPGAVATTARVNNSARTPSQHSTKKRAEGPPAVFQRRLCVRCPPGPPGCRAMCTRLPVSLASMHVCSLGCTWRYAPMFLGSSCAHITSAAG